MSNYAVIANSVLVALADYAAELYRPDAVEVAIRQTLRIISNISPRHTVDTLTLTAAGRELDLSSLGSHITPVEIWLPYTASDPENPPNRRHWDYITGARVWITDDPTPSAGDVARVIYQAPHTLADLDGATTTTLDDAHLGALISGAICQTILSRHAQVASTRKTAETGLDAFTNPNLIQLYRTHKDIFDQFIADRRAKAAGGIYEIRSN